MFVGDPVNLPMGYMDSRSYLLMKKIVGSTGRRPGIH